ncbi:penicillin acylase family protein [Kordiimonas sp.]|uniref:penicillin acylase family protein n=1 Tax=Kordiimonas sp. TaxID=1970157 RepID=UPI003A95A111
MRAVKLWSSIVLLFLICVLFLAFGWMRSSLPKVSGTVTLEGPTAPITIARHAHGIPHIGAASEHDLQFAIGYVHAQDRLWQMEMNRRIGNGRVAEVLGEAGLGFDRYFRTLGFRRKAESALANLDEATRSALQAYANGVNAYARTRKGALPPEFVLTGVKPEPWSPVDTLVWQKMMWLDLSGNMRSELSRAKLLSKLTPAQVRSIYPPYPGDEESPFPDLGAIYARAGIDGAAALVGPEKQEGYGSNNWVVDGSMTKSGMPLLANDPHLGLTTPSIWYLARLHNTTTGTNVIGVTFPGTPSVILGRNDKIAWGFTNTAPDIQDLFVEKLVGDDGTQYLTPDGPADFTTRVEVIKVKGGDDIHLTVKETRHGPVVSDVLGDRANFIEDGYVLALQWTALGDTDTAPTGLLKLSQARDFEAFKAAGQYYFGPEQNMIYADTDGNIGYYAPAQVPVRHSDNEIMGRLPSPGWIAKYDWQGFIPYEELPTYFNPEGGVIATANEKIVDGDYPHFITRDWALPYRGNRIRAELERLAPHDLDSFKALHGDVVSDMARDLLPVLKVHLAGEGEVADALLAWDGTMDADRPEPLIFHEFMRSYQARLMNDELGSMAEDFTGIRSRLIRDSLLFSAPDGFELPDAYYHLTPIDREAATAWCDDIVTEDKIETCGELAKAALRDTVHNLSVRRHDNWTTWKWGDEHILTQSHRPMSQVPVVSSFFEIETPISGSRNTINVAGVSESKSTLNRSTFGPSYRGIFDLSDLNKSLYVLPTGQSGNPFSGEFDDLFPRWRDVEYITIPASGNVTDGAEDILILHPH